jgi:YD repeat-containing protein
VQTVDATGAVFATGYDAFSRIISRIDALGNSTTIAYDHATRSSTITTPEGVTVTTVMNRHGQTQLVIDGNGNVTTYAYDRNGNLLSTATPLALTTQRFDAGNRLTETIDGNGTRTVLAYDAANRMLSRIVDPGGLALATTYVHDALGRMVHSTDANGVATTYRYDALGQLREQVLDPNGLALTTRLSWNSRGQQLSVTDPNGVTTRYAYDNLGRRISETVDPDGLALTTRYAYDANGNLITRTDANGQISRYAYDAENRLVASVDAQGGVVITRYDANGRIASTVAYAQAIPLDSLPVAAYLAAITARLQASPGDQSSSRVYDRDGRVAATVDGTGAVVTYRYDGNGNAIERRAYARPIALASWRPGTLPTVQPDDAHDLRLRTWYDAANRAIASIDGVGALTLQRYDANGNLLSRTAYATPVDPGLALAFTSADAASRIASTTKYIASIADVITSTADRADQYRYDAANRVALHVDGIGAVTRYAHDANGNLLRSIAHATALPAGQDPATIAASAADRITDRAYDAANRLLWEVDALGGVTAWQRDANSNVLRTIRHAQPVTPPSAATPPWSASALQQAVQSDATADRINRRVYDTANRLLFAIDAEGAVTAYRYDSLGQRIASTAHANTLDAQALAAIDAQGSTSPGCAQQANGLLAIATRLAAITSRIAPDAVQDRSSRQYFDAAGRIAASVDALGNVTASRYDALGRLLQREQLARPLDLATTALPAELKALQALLRRDPAVDHVEQQTWDAAGRLQSKTDALGQTESWTHDALGNQLSYRNALGALWTYDHDAAGRTIRETTPEVDLVSTAATNATSSNFANDGSASLAASFPPDALSISHAGPTAIVTTLAYDALGNLTARTEALGRAEQRTTRYDYDALGRQIRTTFPPVGVYAAELDDPGSNVRTGLATRTERIETLYTETRYDALGNAISGRDVAGAISYKTYDRLGRLEFEIDALGQVTGHERNAFGDITRLTRYQVAIALPTPAPQAGIDSARVSAALRQAEGDRSVQQSYDRAGRLLRSEQTAVDAYDSSAPNGQQVFHAGPIATQRYNAFGERIQSRQLKNPLTDAWLQTATWYDRAGRDIASLDAAGYLTTQTWDAWGKLLSRTEWAEPQGGMAASPPYRDSSASSAPVATQPGPDDRLTLYRYDQANRLISQTQAGILFTDADTGLSQRGDATTTYGYDALGNLTRTTDALGAATYTYYDALGRIAAVAAPARPGPDGAMLIPLTRFERDAHGNVLRQTVHALGASRADASGYVAANASSADQVTLNRYDSHGHLLHTQDAEGVSRYQSFDARGQLTKRWQSVTDDQRTRTLWQAWRYDALGRQTHALEALNNDGGTIDRATAWNAFGEVIAQGTDGRWETYYDRDAAGRVWRTNEQGGLPHIALYDLQGNVTAGISSNGDTPVSARSPLDALQANSVRRTDTRYDALGRVIGRLLPEQRIDLLQADSQGGLHWLRLSDAAQNLRLQAAGSAAWLDASITDLGQGESGADISNLAPGSYRYELIRTDASGQPQRTTGTVQIDPGTPARQIAADGLPTIGGITLQAGSLGGRAGTEDAAAWIVWQGIPAGSQQQFRYRAAGSADAWAERTITSRGNGYFGVDRRGIGGGRYEYQLVLTATDGAARTVAGSLSLKDY